jgi:hypothetical protein
MAPRANWKGYLRLSLVSCPIALYPASSLSEKVSFNRLNRKTGNRLKQQNVDSETGEVVPREDTARGYEVAKGQYLIVENEELDAVQVESTRTIDIDQFVPKAEIDERYIDSPYYIAPDGQVGEDTFAVIRDTIGKLNMVAPGGSSATFSDVFRPVFGSPPELANGCRSSTAFSGCGAVAVRCGTSFGSFTLDFSGRCRFAFFGRWRGRGFLLTARPG